MSSASSWWPRSRPWKASPEPSPARSFTSRPTPAGGSERPAALSFAIVAFYGQLDQAVDQLRVGNARGLPHLRVHGDRGEAGDRVDLVHHDLLRFHQEEVDPGHARAVDGPERHDRGALDLPGHRRREVGRHLECGALVQILRPVVVELRVGDDFSWDRGDGVVVAEHSALDLPGALHRSLDQRLAGEREGFLDRRRKVLRSLHLRDAHRGAERGWLDEQWKAEARRAPLDARPVPFPVAVVHHLVVDHAKPRGLEQHLLDRLVHPDRGSKHARADVRNPGQLQHPLDRAVLAERPVQDREHHVDLTAGAVVGDHRGVPGLTRQRDARSFLGPNGRERPGTGRGGERVAVVPAAPLVHGARQGAAAGPIEGRPAGRRAPATRAAASWPPRMATASMAPNPAPPKSTFARSWSGWLPRPEYPTSSTLGCPARASASARAVEHWRSIRRGKVWTPRRVSHASKAPAVVPCSIASDRMRSISSCEPATAPPIASEWPLMYFVVECTTTVTPG